LPLSAQWDPYLKIILSGNGRVTSHGTTYMRASGRTDSLGGALGCRYRVGPLFAGFEGRNLVHYFYGTAGGLEIAPFQRMRRNYGSQYSEKVLLLEIGTHISFESQTAHNSM